jgi:hypothetical protein
MLYANGKFIPPPRVFYTTERDKRTWSITIGDAQYAVVSSFFDILEEEEENTKVREMCRLIGTFARVTRVIYWAECDPTLYTLENSRDRCSYNAVTVPKDKCFFLSDHYGYLTSESQDVVAIVRDKMFIFE